MSAFIYYPCRIPVNRPYAYYRLPGSQVLKQLSRDNASVALMIRYNEQQYRRIHKVFQC